LGVLVLLLRVFVFILFHLIQIELTMLRVGVNGRFVFQKCGQNCNVKESGGKITIEVQSRGKNTIAFNDIYKA
jgi:hypothetical protein